VEPAHIPRRCVCSGRGGAAEIRIKIPSRDASFFNCNRIRSTPKQWALHFKQWSALLPFCRRRAGQTLKPDAQDRPIEISHVTVQHVKGPLFLPWIRVYIWQESLDMMHSVSPRDQKPRLSTINSDLWHRNSKHIRIAIYNNITEFSLYVRRMSQYVTKCELIFLLFFCLVSILSI
jgi:hypothetical protein